MSEFIYEKITKDQPIRICEVTASEHTDGDGAFFAQNAARDPGEFNSRLNELVEANQLQTLSPGVRPTVGMHIVAQFNEDDLWYRAEVTKSNPRGITVTFIDYGNTEDIPTEALQQCVRKLSSEICDVPAFAYRIRDNMLYDKSNFSDVLDGVYGALTAHYGEEIDLAMLDIWRLIPTEDMQQKRYTSSTDFWGDIECRLGDGFKWVGLSEVAESGLKIMHQKEEQSVDQTILHPVSPSVPSESIQTNFENTMPPIGQPSNRSHVDQEQYSITSTLDQPRSVFKLPEDAVKGNRMKVWISECSNGVLCLQPDAGEQFEVDMANYHEQLTIKAGSLPPAQKFEIGACGVACFENAWYRAIIIETEPVPKAFFVDYGNGAEIAKGLFLQDESIFQRNLFAFPIQVPPHLEKSINSLGQQSLLEDPERWTFYLEISQITSHCSWELPLVVGNVYVQDRNLPEKKLKDYVEKPEEVTLHPTDASQIEPPSSHSTRMDQSGLNQTDLPEDDVPLSELQSVQMPRIPKADLEIGKVYPIFFHEHEEGKPFYVSPLVSGERHEILELQILTTFEGLTKIEKPELGAGCLGPFMGLPFRAEIIGLKSADTVELLFVDYGNTDVVSTNDVYALPDQEFSNWPRLAFPIKFNVDLNDAQLAKIEEFYDPQFNEDHDIQVKILSVLDNGIQEVECMVNSQPIQDYLTQAEVDQCQSHVDPIEDPEDFDPSEEPKALSNIDGEHSGMSNIQQIDTTISDPMAKREAYQEQGITNPTVSVNQKTYNPGQELYLKVMKVTKDNGIPTLHGFFLEDEDRIIHISDELDAMMASRSLESGGNYHFENDQIVSVKTQFFGGEGEFSRGKIINGAKDNQMIIKFIDYEITDPKIPRSSVFPYNKEFAGPAWVSGGVLGTVDNIDWSIEGALEAFDDLINNTEVQHREPNCVPIKIIESKDVENFFSMHLTPDPSDDDFNKIMKKYSPSEKRTVLGEVQNVPECLVPSRSRTASTKTNCSGSSGTRSMASSLTEHTYREKMPVNKSENRAAENINPAENTNQTGTGQEWSDKWSISNSTAATSIAQHYATLENKFDTVIITKVSKKRVQDGSGSANLYSICSCAKIESWYDHNRIITEAMETNMKNGDISPIDTFVEAGTQVIVRDKVYYGDASDAGFRRAIAGTVTDDNYQLFKLIDTQKMIGLKMKGSTRVYPSPSIISDIKSIREEIIIEESLGVKEGDQIRFSPKLEAPGRPGTWFGDVIADIKIPQLVQMMTVIQEKLNSSGDALSQQKLGLIKSKLSSINDLLQ